jgi:hypothetical protein
MIQPSCQEREDWQVLYGSSREVAMKIARLICIGLLAGTIHQTESFLMAQTNPAGEAVSIRGKVTSLKGQELLVAASNGTVSVKVPDTTTIRVDVPIQLSDIAPGMYVGASAQKQPDGTFRASRVHIFSEDQRGFNEGHGPQSSIPNSTMTNAHVDKIEEMAVQDVKGPVLTLKFKDGQVKVFVPPDAPVVKRVAGSRDSLQPGAGVVIRATRAADGAISASEIRVSDGPV